MTTPAVHGPVGSDLPVDTDPLVPRPIDLPTPVPLDAGADLGALDDAKILAAPPDPSDWPRWRVAIARWAGEARRRKDYDDAAYRDPAASWTHTAWSVALIWLWDEELYDHAAHQFTVDAFLDRTGRRFGALDAIVLWHAYPVIGIDPRNQYDYYRDVPDLAGVVEQFHAHGVRVFLDYNPWDVGTRRSEGTDAEECAALVRDTRADGLFLDTLKSGAPALVDALQTLGRPVALEGESKVSLERIVDHSLSWAQWFADSEAPGVLGPGPTSDGTCCTTPAGGTETTRTRSSRLGSTACGVLLWENVFGSWVGWSDRDAGMYRRMLSVFRAFPDVLLRGDWTPLDDLGPHRPARVFGSRFASSAIDLILLVNRDADPVSFPWAGRPDRKAVCLDTGTVDVTLPGRGIAAVVEYDPADAPSGLPEQIAALIRSLADDPVPDDAGFRSRTTVRIPVSPAFGVPTAPAVRIAAQRYELIQTYRRRETGWYGEVPYIEEWKPLPPRLHDQRCRSVAVELGDVAVDAAEVTRGEFHRFVRESGYVPAVSHRFTAALPPEPGTESDPVTGVDLADARAYAAWRRARLPTEWEWQVAADLPGFTRLRPEVVELDRERAHGRAQPVRDPQGWRLVRRRRLGLVHGRGTAGCVVRSPDPVAGAGIWLVRSASASAARSTCPPRMTSARTGR